MEKFLKTGILLILLGMNSCTNTNEHERYINYLDHKVYYELYGDSSDIIVFIHGWTGNIQSWKYQLNSFSDYKVIAIDLPGHGKSSRNEKTSYTMELFADSVNAVLKSENINKAFFIGHSMGFAVIEVIAIKYPDLCTGICSIDGTHFVLPEDAEERDAWIQYNREFARSME